jgi:hypothetical protein
VWIAKTFQVYRGLTFQLEIRSALGQEMPKSSHARVIKAFSGRVNLESFSDPDVDYCQILTIQR